MFPVYYPHGPHPVVQVSATPSLTARLFLPSIARLLDWDGLARHREREKSKLMFHDRDEKVSNMPCTLQGYKDAFLLPPR